MLKKLYPAYKLSSDQLICFFLVSIFSFSLSGCVKKTDEIKPDLILTNGHIWTGEDSASFVNTIAITGNIISHVGEANEIMPLAGDHTKIIDLHGKLVTAGFNDAHIHFLNGSIGLSQVELTSMKSLDAVIGYVLKYAKDNPTKPWITGRGWQYTFFSTGLPDRNTMKALELDRPVYIKAYDGHSAWANKKAFAMAGITSSTQFNGFGEIVKDKNGNPTGTLQEEAMTLVSNFIPPLTEQEKLDALRMGLKLAASLGITSIQNANGDETEVRLFKTLLNNNELTLRYAAAFSVDETTTDEQIDRFTKLKDSVGLSNPYLRADAIKFVLDGVIEGHSAGMIKPYADMDPNDKNAQGSLSMPVEKYQQMVSLFNDKGFRIYTHAIGDLAVREALNAYEKAMARDTTRSYRHRIEHIETISPIDLPRFKKLGVLPSMEPIHADPATIGVWQKAIGDERLPYSFAWNSMLKNGAHLVYSSDWPAAISINPIRGIHVAVNRRDPSGFPIGGWIPDQKIHIDKALKAYTQGGSYSSFEENKKGLIARGQLADVVVFSDDLFLIDPMKTHEVNVVLTIFDGKIIYQK